MMRRSVICFTLAVATCLGSAQGPDIARDFVLTDKEAVGLLSPRVVCGSKTLELKWSPDGSVLLARRMDLQSTEDYFISAIKAGGIANLPPGSLRPKQDLVFYSPRTGKVRATVPLGDPDNQVFDLQWVPGSQQVFVEYERIIPGSNNQPPQSTINLAFVSYDGRVTPILEADANTQNFQTSVSPTRPLIAIINEISSDPPLTPTPGDRLPTPPRKRKERIRLFNASGRVVADSVADVESFAVPMWGSDGGFYLAVRKLDPTKRKLVATYQKVDLATGRVSPAAVFPGEYQEKEVTQDVLAVPMTLSLQKKTVPERATAMAIISSGKRENAEYALISTDSDMALISPNGEWVGYVSRGVAMVRPLVHVPKEMFMQARAAARRAELVNRGKQVALGILMWAADNDDNYPANGADLQGLLGPYLKDNNMLDGFVYTFPGGSATSIENPAETEIGYLPGEGGRAVVYSDGHVKWKNDAP